MKKSKDAKGKFPFPPKGGKDAKAGKGGKTPKGFVPFGKKK